MLVMIHGIGDCGADMACLSDVLRGDLPVFAPDRRRLPASATFDDTVNDFVKQLDEAKVGPSYFLGYSFGGLVALTLAHRHPERVRGVIGLAAKVLYDPKTLAFLRHIINLDRLRQTMGHKVPSYEKRWGMSLDVLAASAMSMYEGFASRAPLDDSDLSRIKAPVLLVSGDIDQVTPLQETRHLEAMLPNARAEFFQGRAHPISSVPVLQVKEAVLGFIREVEDGRFGDKPLSVPQPSQQPARAWLG